MAETPDYPIAFKKLTLAAFMAYGLGLVVLFLPAEAIVLQGEEYSISLWYQHSGTIAATVLILMGSLQGLWWKRRRRWLFWPGVTAGLYISAFSVMRLLNLYSQKETADGLQNEVGAVASPQMGLLLLLAVGIGLLIQMGLLYSIRPASKVGN